MTTHVAAPAAPAPYRLSGAPRRRVRIGSWLITLSVSALLGIAGGLAVGGVAHAGQWVRCAPEGGHCKASADATHVRFGDGKTWAPVVALTNGRTSAWCTRETFGRDPALNRTKHCEYYDQTWEYCMHENGFCRGFKPGSKVRYGVAANDAFGRYYTRTISGDGVSCRNTVFGDPAPGLKKSCWVLK